MAKARSITGLDLQASIAKNARIIAHERLTDMYACARHIDDPEHIKQLHDLRIAAKRMRYTLEIFADYLPAASQDFAQELATLQDELGEFHDSEVMLALLRLALQTEQPGQYRTGEREALLPSDLIADILEPSVLPGAEEHEGLARFLQRQEQRREQSYNAFRRHWQQLEQSHFRQQLLAMLDRKEEHQVDHARG